MNLKEIRKGELAVLGEAVLWALFPIVTILSYSSFSPALSLAWSSLFAAVFFGLVMLFRGKTKELFFPGIYKYVVLIALFIGWLFYGFYFLGLKYTTSGNASIIALMEIFFAYLLFNVWKKQVFSPAHTVGALLMLFGALIILYPKQGLSFHGGDWLVLTGTAFATFGNYYQQKLRKKISSETMLFLRSLLTFPFFFFLAFVLKTDSQWLPAGKVLWLMLLNGFFILGFSKLMWLEGIHRISVTKAEALASIGPLLTLFYAYIFIRQIPTIWQLASFFPLAAGLILLTYEKSPNAGNKY